MKKLHYKLVLGTIIFMQSIRMYFLYETFINAAASDTLHISLIWLGNATLLGVAINLWNGDKWAHAPLVVALGLIFAGTLPIMGLAAAAGQTLFSLPCAALALTLLYRFSKRLAKARKAKEKAEAIAEAEAKAKAEAEAKAEAKEKAKAEAEAKAKAKPKSAETPPPSEKPPLRLSDDVSKLIEVLID